MMQILKKMIRKVVPANSQVKSSSHLRVYDEKYLRRSFYLYELFKRVEKIEGSVIECGVGEGQTRALFCSLITLENTDRSLWGFDTYEGFPEPAPQDELDNNEKMKKRLESYRKFDVKWVRKTLLDFGISASDIDRRIVFAKGVIPNSLSLYDNHPVALLHLDLDIYSSYKEAMNFFWDKVTPGGIIAFDEYNKPMDIYKWPGAGKAINEFLDSKNLRSKLVKDKSTGNVYLVK